MQSLTSPVEWAASQREAGSKEKRAFGVQASRAWQIAPEEYADVDIFLPKTYAAHNPQLIGSQGVPIDRSEVSKLLSLTGSECLVYKQDALVIDEMAPLGNLVLKTSRAIHQGAGPRPIGEVDGPKYIYILRLAGNVAHYLGWNDAKVAGRSIIKVGFSKSPNLRMKQLQSAYPDGSFKWQVIKPEITTAKPMFENAAAAIIAEDAMKARLTNEGAMIVGGEFFLADDDMIIRAWNAGRFANG